jgi:CheY-like chemotaxis protein
MSVRYPRNGLLALVVEDDFMVAKMLETALHVRGFSVMGPVATAKEALNLMAALTPDVALLDYRLKIGTTEGLLPTLERLGARVCFLSGFAYPGMSPLFDKYPLLMKPFKQSELFEFLDQSFGDVSSWRTRPTS